MKQNED